MSKIVFFNLPATGHINPSLPLMAELLRRGEQIIYVNTEETRRQIEPSGVRFVPYPDLPELAASIDRAAGGKLSDNAVALAEIAEKIIPWAVDLLRSEAADVVLFDSISGWGKQAAEIAGLPTIAAYSTFAIDPRVMKIPPFELMKLGFELMSRLPRYQAIARRTRQRTGAKPLGFVKVLGSTGDINLVYTSKEFQPGAHYFDNTYKFVGPMFGLRPTAGDFPYDQLTRHPLIYISLGTINNQNLDFYRACFDAFASHPGQFILSAGKQTDLSTLGSIPANFLVRNHVPQLDLLQKVDLFISHGGLNSTHESLYYGVPLIVVPQQQEQLLVSQQIEAKGAGIALIGPPLGKVSVEQLRSAVEKVVQFDMRGQENPYRAAARKVGDTLRAAGGAPRAADEIQAFAAAHGKKRDAM